MRLARGAFRPSHMTIWREGPRMLCASWRDQEGAMPRLWRAPVETMALHYEDIQELPVWVIEALWEFLTREHCASYAAVAPRWWEVN